uniref:mRNA m(6)A methyltransferase n=1 Tax=Strigamia maritima TaxID=126957 RepID=T1J262_STRMM
MSDTWSDIQAHKFRQSSLREKIQKRKKEREEIVNSIANDLSPTVTNKANTVESRSNSPTPIITKAKDSSESDSKCDPDVESKLLLCLCDVALNLPTDSRALGSLVSKALNREASNKIVENLLQKFAAQELISLKDGFTPDGKSCLNVTSAEHTKLTAVSNDLIGIQSEETTKVGKKRKHDSLHDDETNVKIVKDNLKKDKKDESIESLLSMPSIREKENKKMGEEILDLLSKPTAKERSLAERFRSQGGAQVQEFCPHGIREECAKVSGNNEPCRRLHFKKIIQKHTDESLGDCSFLNTCFHMDTCKYVHYEVDYYGAQIGEKFRQERELVAPKNLCGEKDLATLHPPQWIQCDLRYFDMTILGKFAVVMADPPWDIHMELPYGTMSDDEMRQLNIPALQDDGLIFLWVTGRAMELGRECLKLWGYERCDEIIWVKTNQLQRIIRTGRTGHWLNHGKEHCLVGVKGNPKGINRGLDCDVIVAEVRATSHKPDEIYGMIERLSPGTRKIELFGRPHNIQPNWCTLGNQLDGVRLMDMELIHDFKKAYPDGNCMVPMAKS